MQKIPTVFVRNPDDRKHVTSEVAPGCEWVLAGEGVPTRKYDGTCCMFDGEQWWARREVKDGGRWPEEFQALSRDATTGRTVGWQPMRFSGFAKWLARWAGDEGYEGIVWHHPDGRMAKLKARDIPPS